MPKNKILCIGNNSDETDVLTRAVAEKLNLPYKGLLEFTELNFESGVYHTSIEDININNIFKIIKHFDKVEIFDQPDSIDKSAYIQRQILKRQIEFIDTDYTTIEDKILYIGCSHTAGIGHTNPSTVYTNILSSLLNKESIIRGNPGKGNYLIEEILNSYSLTNSLVVIQFTDIFRIRYFDNNGMLVEKQGRNLTRAEVDFFTEEKLTKDFFALVNRIVIRLRDARAKFLFFQLSQSHPTQFLLQDYMSKFKEFCWIPDANLDFADDALHFGTESHKLIAHRLLERYKKIYA